jgi:signal peptidase
MAIDSTPARGTELKRRKHPRPFVQSHKTSGRADALNALARSFAFRRGIRVVLAGAFIALTGVLLLVATATVPVLFGYHTYTVNGGSMEPAVHSGSVAVTAPTASQGLKVGDVIGYRSSSDVKPVLHRIIRIDDKDGKRLFVTQGDQNRTPDAEPVALKGPGDRLVYSVPYAGYVLNFAGTVTGRAALIGGPLLLLAVMFVIERTRPLRPRRRGHGASAGSRLPDAPAEEGEQSAWQASIPDTWLVTVGGHGGPASALIATVPKGWRVRADLLRELLAA